MTLSELIASKFDIAAMRAVETATAVNQLAATNDVISNVGGLFSTSAISQAIQYRDRPQIEHVIDGVSHAVFNALRSERAGTTVPVHISRSKLDLINTVEGMFQADVAWREAAKTDGTLAAALVYWDKIDNLAAFDMLSQSIFTMLVGAGICTAAVRTAIEDACTQIVPGPTSTDLHDAALDSTTYDDVRAIIASQLGS